MSPNKLIPLALFVALALSAGDAVPTPPPELKVTLVPESLVKALSLSPFYKKYVDAKGFPVLGSEKVRDAAMLESARIVNRMLEGRDDIRAAITVAPVRIRPWTARKASPRSSPNVPRASLDRPGQHRSDQHRSGRPRQVTADLLKAAAPG